MPIVDPNQAFQGRILIVAPHMDDEALACGGLIARLSQKERIHIVYATDGMQSPKPVLPMRFTDSFDLAQFRMQEAIAAMGFLGIAPSNIRFLGLPDGELAHHKQALTSLLKEEIKHVNPENILVPFRYDRHPDHIALNHVATNLYQHCKLKFTLIEYFVYYRWRLLPGGDVRRYVPPSSIIQVDITSVSERKRAALDFFKSQTTKYFAWQTRPNLTTQILDEVSLTPELFLRYDQNIPGAAVLTRYTSWIRIAHQLESFLKTRKDQIVALLKGEFLKNGTRLE